MRTKQQINILIARIDDLEKRVHQLEFDKAKKLIEEKCKSEGYTLISEKSIQTSNGNFYAKNYILIYINEKSFSTNRRFVFSHERTSLHSYYSELAKDVLVAWKEFSEKGAK